jgi:transposase
MPEKSPGHFAALVGIDWADQHHDLSLVEVATGAVERRRIVHTPEAIGEWTATLQRRFGGEKIAIAVETSRGPLIHALLEYDFIVLYPVNPRSLQRFREAFAPSGAKDDLPDADLLREMLEKHRDRLRAWEPAKAKTRLLARLVEDRRRCVDLRTKLVQQLQAALKEYFPQAISLAGEDLSSMLACNFLLRWPSLNAVKRARRDTVRKFYYAHNCRSTELIEQRLEEIRASIPLTRDPAIIKAGTLLVQTLAGQLKALAPNIKGYDEEIKQCFAAHKDDAVLFSALPGSGPALAPRLLALFGTDRSRYKDARELQQLSGIAPVTRRSGKSTYVHWRWAAPTFARQTFHEFAGHSIRSSTWARVYYDLQRERGKEHHAAVRALAFKWIRILWRCWKDETPYDEHRYIESLIKRGSPLAARLNTQLAA